MACSFPKKIIRALGESNFVNFEYCAFVVLLDSVACYLSQFGISGDMVGEVLVAVVGEVVDRVVLFFYMI